MNRSLRLFCPNIIVAVMAGLTLQSCVPANVGMWLQVKHYTGDGVAESTSMFWWPGYLISFPEFDPRLPFEAKYRLMNVPQRDGKSGVFALEFRPPLPSSQRGEPTGAYAFVLKRGDGTVVKSGVVDFRNALWSQTQMEITGVYDREKCLLDLKPNTGYTLYVKYAPGPRPALTTGVYFCLENRGGK